MRWMDSGNCRSRTRPTQFPIAEQSHEMGSLKTRRVRPNCKRVCHFKLDKWMVFLPPFCILCCGGGDKCCQAFGEKLANRFAHKGPHKTKNIRQVRVGQERSQVKSAGRYKDTNVSAHAWRRMSERVRLTART